MVVDSSRSPIPSWKRAVRMLLLAAVIVVIGLLIWTKELHHPLTGSGHKSQGAALVQPYSGRI